jgi:hypothetical protein
MIINAPCLITPRLLPGVRINDAWLSIKYNGITSEGRDRYLIYLDTPKGEHVIDDIASGCQGGSLQGGLESCLGFMAACAESRDYQQRTGEETDNADLFSEDVGQWFQANSDEISMMQNILSEEKNLIDEG